MTDELRRKTRYRGERCTSKLTLDGDQVQTAQPNYLPTESVADGGK